MEEFWARFIDPSGRPGLNYWEYFAERLVQQAAISKKTMIMDLGTYDGNVLLKAMKKMKRFGFGVGADIYYGGFKDGVAVVREQKLEQHVVFVQTDARALGFQSGIFQTVLGNFIGWDDCFDFERLEFKHSDRMMASPASPGIASPASPGIASPASPGMAEIFRVLRPGGQVGIGSWVEQSDLDWITGAFKKFLPEEDKNIVCYARENPEGQKIILENSGFKDIRVCVETANFVLPDREMWWRQMRQAAQEYFQRLSDPNTLQRFKEQVFADLGQFQSPEGIRFRKTVSFAFGHKPG